VELTKHEPRWYLPYLWYDYIEKFPDYSTHFVIIDTMAYDQQVNNYTMMETWLDYTLTASTADWKIVIGHHSIYSSGFHGPVTSSTLVYRTAYCSFIIKVALYTHTEKRTTVNF